MFAAPRRSPRSLDTGSWLSGRTVPFESTRVATGSAWPWSGSGCRQPGPGPGTRSGSGPPRHHCVCGSPRPSIHSRSRSRWRSRSTQRSRPAAVPVPAAGCRPRITQAVTIGSSTCRTGRYRRAVPIATQPRYRLLASRSWCPFRVNPSGHRLRMAIVRVRLPAAGAWTGTRSGSGPRRHHCDCGSPRPSIHSHSRSRWRSRSTQRSRPAAVPVPAAGCRPRITQAVTIGSSSCRTGPISPRRADRHAASIPGSWLPGRTVPFESTREATGSCMAIVRVRLPAAGAWTRTRSGSGPPRHHCVRGSPRPSIHSHCRSRWRSRSTQRSRPAAVPRPGRRMPAPDHASRDHRVEHLPHWSISPRRADRHAAPIPAPGLPGRTVPFESTARTSVPGRWATMDLQAGLAAGRLKDSSVPRPTSDTA